MKEQVRKTSMYSDLDGEGSVLNSLVDIDEIQREKQGALSKDEFTKMYKLISVEDRKRGALVGSSLIEYSSPCSSPC